jgi:hypothetical protein
VVFTTNVLAYWALASAQGAQGGTARAVRWREFAEEGWKAELLLAGGRARN